jgi:hypothetical protein
MRVFACNVVSKLPRNRCISFGDWRSRKTGPLHFYIYRYIYIYIYIYIKVTSKHARIRLQRCVKIATKSVHYFWRLEVLKKLAVTFLYI